jgi:hypothetical protein
MSVSIRIVGDAESFPNNNHFPGLTCDVCREPIVNHHSAWAAWFQGEEEDLCHVHTEEGCVDVLEEFGKDKGKMLMTDTLTNHFRELLFILGFEEGSVTPRLERDK